ncbi:TIGR01777 family oxidoreductase [Paenibacillus sp. IITD108]|uniref:TIGR01777 family oxidoreductase n=1 Tax=Paenibacillus sp. IITD108 TaxID=3116649 RepID=UPI002F3F984C
MRVAIAGGSGFIGQALAKALLERNNEVIIISRHKASRDTHEKLQSVTWMELAANHDKLEGMDAVVNLAGESINQRWTANAKQRIVQSRLWSAAQLAGLFDMLHTPPPLIINASGISAYGDAALMTCDENSPTADSDFLSKVVKSWEQAADSIPAQRLIKLRIGVVLSLEGGAFPLMALPYRLFGGGRIGKGTQGISWIHLDDLVRLIIFCLEQPDLSGVVNASAPEPVANDQFGRAIGRAMKRPHWLPVPAPAFRLLLGEMADLLLTGQRAVPRKALKHGFQFLYPTVDSAMQQLFKNNNAK